MQRLVVAQLCLFLACSPASALPKRAEELRNRGFAELENEKPEQAESAYEELIGLLPEDPLGHANLAIARLRQQKYPEALTAIDTALAKAKGRGDLLAIRGEILQWTGDLEGALINLRDAAEAEPQNQEILYSLYRLATTLKTEESEKVAGEILEKLARLRPENVVVLMQLGQRAIAENNRRRATNAFLRLEELLWQEGDLAHRAMGMVREALEGEDLSKARVPAARLDNVLKIAPMARESLRELQTGIQGIPVERFLDEAPTEGFGNPIDLRLVASQLATSPGAGTSLAVGDFDGDGRPDLARIRGGEQHALELRPARSGWRKAAELATPGATGVSAVDLDNDGRLDLLAHGPKGSTLWLGQGDGSFQAAPEQMGLAQAGAQSMVAVDFDIEGDLDLALAGGTATVDLYRNNLAGPLERVGDKAFPALEMSNFGTVTASDLDRDGDLDLLLAHGGGLSWLDNLRQGRFRDRGAETGLAGPAARAAISADLDNDGQPDLVAAGDGLRALRNDDAKFRPWSLSGLPTEGDYSALLAFDADNDGRQDLALGGAAGLQVLTQKLGSDTSFSSVSIAEAPAKVSALAASDLDGDGDLDLLADGPNGLFQIQNDGGNANAWLSLSLRGLSKGNSKNNHFGTGSLVEVRNGRAYQFHEATGDVLHLGLGQASEAAVLRVVWTNGVPQNRIALEGKQTVVEEQLLKGSCPFLYAWNGESFDFVTDLLWGAPVGLPAAPGKWVDSDPSELVKIGPMPTLENREGKPAYALRLTEELWEAAFFDQVRLWVVDHPAAVEVASNLRILPGEALGEEVLASRELRPLAAAWDGRGREVTATVATRDDVYADGYRKSPYQGVAAETWAFTFDLGQAPGKAVRLHLDGWIFPADASLNLAVAQRQDLPYLPPRLEVETANGWQVLMPNMGFPAGKTKTMVVDTPPLPLGAQRLRLVSSLWLHWDRIAWTLTPADHEARVVAKLTPSQAELRYRGFSALVREAPNAPHTFDYARVSLPSPWAEPLPGHYTRFGDVRDLLLQTDDRSVIMAPGDEIDLLFEATDLTALPEGWVRSLFLESHGWDKDADRNTGAGQELGPLPFRAMQTYPYGAEETFPRGERHQQYLRRWQTRWVE